MPNRIVREGILTSARVASLGWAEEVFFRRLMSVVDDFGRYYADPGLLRAACYPRQLNKVSDSDIGKWMRCVAEAALVRVYPAEDGERYLEVVNFGQPVRAKKSKYPSPPEDESICLQTHSEREQPKADSSVFVSVSVSECVSECDSAQARDPPQKSKPKPSKRCPADFEVSEDMRQWAAENARGVDIRAETAKFMDYEFGKAYSDWPATWRNWIRKAAENGRPRQNAPPSRDFGRAAAGNSVFGRLMGSEDDERTIDMVG